MKKIVAFLLFVSLLFSCSVSDDTPRSHFEFLPIESVNMPDTFTRYQTHTIDLFYNLPSTCHVLNDIYYAINENERTVAIVSEVYTTSDDCQEISTEAETSFGFTPTESGVYVFKFWQGEDELGEDQYHVVEIEVVE
ncbi:hypothetical protein KO494_01005 [Lacinutrix sp. C3R15]|uniref:hypothetical protein n=1 Tax=Flavobacteriaceae TaxID=49546 RepID=UPI001C090EC5|nr:MULTISPECIES: hypothetical protein [Flavobacteriaceae]MBU2938105.1 hypothetical protein [Lacinutrix sp. C3R15]MDO6621419.1 hypothetical protein [Oceanihabitans sp. 1_MG-2023]